MNRGVPQRLGQPTAYKLLPAAAPTLLAHPESSVAQAGRLRTHNLWVTPFAPEERPPPASTPTSTPAGRACPGGRRRIATLVDTDVVLWHTFGVTHVPRPEDWPVMPVEYTGFSLIPYGFFDRNPALDVPPDGPLR